MTAQHRQLLLGPPGCGKTERLLTELERRLAAGVPPERVAFVSFTRAAVREARERAGARFGLTGEQLPLFRTLHSHAFRLVNATRAEILDRRDLDRLAELTGEQLTGKTDLDEQTLGDRGDLLLFLDQTARNSLRDLRAVWHERGAALDWWRLRRFTDAYAAYRADHLRSDFTDLLERALAPDAPVVDADVVFVDEAQDLTPLQWRVVERCFAGAREIVVAGDDDQAIYAWSGADVEALLSFDGEREVLAQSYRLPRAVHALAVTVSARLGRRLPKKFYPRDATGAVEWVARPEELDLSAGSWLLLARTRRQLAPLVEVARRQGVTYAVMGRSAVDAPLVRSILAWEALRRGSAIDAADARELVSLGAVRPFEVRGRDRLAAVDLGLGHGPALPIWHDALRAVPAEEREYLVSCLRRGERLTEPPRVRVSTIHGAKGLEADRVLLVTDWTERVRAGAEVDPDAEQRVLYVAVTRARAELYLTVPGRSGYQI